LQKKDPASVIGQLKRYRDAGHFIGNHTCSHLRLDDVGFDKFSNDASKGDTLLNTLFMSQKYFRFPFLNEGKNEQLRDQMRKWLLENRYRNGSVSIDNDDYIFSFKINQAKARGRTIDYKKVEVLFLKHLIGAVNFYDQLATKSLAYSPKHVLLLHEMDATVMFIDSLVKALRNDGWKIIGIDEAYKDKIYLRQPKNLYANNGIIAQIKLEETGKQIGYYNFDTIKDELDEVLGMKNRK